MTKEELSEIEKKVKDEVADSIKFAEESPLPEKSVMFENIYADKY